MRLHFISSEKDLYKAEAEFQAYVIKNSSTFLEKTKKGLYRQVSTNIRAFGTEQFVTRAYWVLVSMPKAYKNSSDDVFFYHYFKRLSKYVTVVKDKHSGQYEFFIYPERHFAVLNKFLPQFYQK